MMMMMILIKITNPITAVIMWQVMLTDIIVLKLFKY